MLDTVRKRCGIPENKFFIEIEELGILFQIRFLLEFTKH